MISSTKLILQLKEKGTKPITLQEKEEIRQILINMPDLESYRVLVWLIVGPSHKTEMADDLVVYLGESDILYDKVLRWLRSITYNPQTKTYKDTGEKEAYKVNGFEKFGDLLNTTKELVACV